MRACSTLCRRIQPSANFSSSSAGAQIVRPYNHLARSHLTPHYPPRYETRSASSFWITISLLTVGGGAWVHHYFTSNDLSVSAHTRPPPQDSFLEVIDTLRNMPVEPAPGTVGTLTPEQEAKLQEFWVLTLKVFGVDLQALESDAKNKESVDAAANSGKKEKSSKRRWGIWGRSNDDEGDDAKSVSSASGITAGLASINITDGDDKYGQTKEFQQALVDMSPEEIRTAFWNMVKQDHPDGLLLRFLRARKWDVKKALVMMISTMRWRLQEVHVDDDIMANGEATALKQSQGSDAAEKKRGEDFMYQIRKGKSFLHGVDRFGRPICVVRVRLHHAGDQEAEGLERFTVYTIETARLLLAPPVETAVSCLVHILALSNLADQIRL